MKEYQPIDTTAQKEALINEFKGNLFEYLVAQFLARHYRIEADFVRSFGGDIRKQLTDYDHWLRVNEPDLIKQLPKLAKEVSLELIDKVLPASATKVLVIGKTLAVPHSKDWAEADLLVLNIDKVYPISLKLCKGNAFVNTKSAGVKSFINQYFCGFSNASLLQNNINRGVDSRFELMAQELHSHVGLDFYGRFDHRWADSGHSELPGQLPKDLNAIVVQSYYDCIKDIYETLKDLYKEDKVLFGKSLLPLMGIGDVDIIQITCFHKEVKGIRYNFSGIHLLYGQELMNDLEMIEILPLKESISSFEIQLNHLKLQIRVKPMNKFTSAAFKINCSIKEIK
ncbi:hypothetical protein [Halobacteriovorax sp. HLS]|uniref:hypothetical protein n=1 Tax=Halobacteriovorax sp. HLS TaxID=2234000 RepID=UPI000FDCC42A|nr:hypothetical protein [Halobacteriovorax sp. HLS]